MERPLLLQCVPEGFLAGFVKVNASPIAMEMWRFLVTEDREAKIRVICLARYSRKCKSPESGRVGQVWGTSGLQLLAQFSSNLWQTQQTVVMLRRKMLISQIPLFGNYPEPIGRHLDGDTFYKHILLIVTLHFRIHLAFLLFKSTLFFSRTFAKLERKPFCFGLYC